MINNKNKQNSQAGLIKMIIVIIIAIALLSWYGVDIKDFFTSPQAQKNFGYVWNFISGIWNDYLAGPIHKLWGIITAIFGSDDSTAADIINRS